MKPAERSRGNRHTKTAEPYLKIAERHAKIGEGHTRPRNVT